MEENPNPGFVSGGWIN
ncbi:hypothetical protein VTO73DRAFT_5128 [Trametes versicolor]